MITFPEQETWPLSSPTMDAGMFHNEKSILSEHYGFTSAIVDDEDHKEFYRRTLAEQMDGYDSRS